MVAEPDVETTANGTTWMSQAALGGALGGGIVGAAMIWFLLGSRSGRTQERTEMSRKDTPRSKGYNWAAAYDDRWDE
jgi:hypothetical protein